MSQNNESQYALDLAADTIGPFIGDDGLLCRCAHLEIWTAVARAIDKAVLHFCMEKMIDPATGKSMNISDGVALIAAERDRQVKEEGFTPRHDDEHRHQQLAIAASCYSMPPSLREERYTTMGHVPSMWPWDWEWWRPSPSNRTKELVKAGALIAAEIERISRDPAAQSAGGGEGKAC